MRFEFVVCKCVYIKWVGISSFVLALSVFEGPVSTILIYFQYSLCRCDKYMGCMRLRIYLIALFKLLTYVLDKFA